MSATAGTLAAMSEHAATIRRFWQTTETRDWGALAEVLAPEMVYEMEQTRERIRGRDGFLRFFDDHPGDWHLEVRRVIADDEGGVSVLDVTVGEEEMLGITFFSFGDDGLITRVENSREHLAGALRAAARPGAPDRAVLALRAFGASLVDTGRRRRLHGGMRCVRSGRARCRSGS